MADGDKKFNLKEIQIFGDRLKKIGIDVGFAGNYPWIYLYQVNGNTVKEKFRSEHGFVAAMLLLSPKANGRAVEFTDIKEIFKMIRKYK